MKIIALGSNIPFKNKFQLRLLKRPIIHWQILILKLLRKSNIYLSEAYPNKSDPLFYNSALSIEKNYNL